MTELPGSGNDTEEIELLLQVRGGRHQSFQPIIEKYWSKVHTLVRRAVKDDEAVEDICQETFLRAFERIDCFDVRRPFAPWVAKIAVNKVREHFRNLNRRVKETALDDWEPTSERPGPAETAIGRLLLEDCLAALPDYHRILFALRHTLMFSYEEIAEILEEPIGSVKSSLYRARALLQERFWRMRPEKVKTEGGTAR